MARAAKLTLSFVYNIIVVFLSFLFLVISGCRPKNPTTDNKMLKSDNRDTSLLKPDNQENKDTNLVEKLNEIKPAAIDGKKEHLPSEHKPKLQNEPYKKVEQPAPDPLQPATAYGTNYREFRPIVKPDNPAD